MDDQATECCQNVMHANMPTLYNDICNTLCGTYSNKVFKILPLFFQKENMMCFCLHSNNLHDVNVDTFVL